MPDKDHRPPEAGTCADFENGTFPLVEHVAIELYDHENNLAVLRLPPRRFPGVLVQGDTLSILCDRASEIRSAISAGDLQQAEDDATALSEELAGMLAQYVAALDRHGVTLPFE